MSQASTVPPSGRVADRTSSHSVTRTRLLDLDRAKGLAILLVVFGHLVSRQDPAGVTWYEPLRIAIYLFHMPFFMYLSGYVLFWSQSGGGAGRPAGISRGANGGSISRRPQPWLFGVAKRARRLLIPFFGFGLLTIAGKLAAAHLMHVDNLPAGGWGALDSLLIHTASSPALSVWYIGVLFVYASVTPLLLRLPPIPVPPAVRPMLARLGLDPIPSVAWLLPVAALLYAIDAPAIVYLDRICRFYIFFVLGGLTATAGRRWWAVLDRCWGIAMVLLLAVIGVVGAGWVHFDWGANASNHFPYKTYMLVAGVLSMIALHGLVRTRLFAGWDWLVWLGNMCFAIYLLNTICLGLSKGILLKFLHWNAHDFPLIAALMMASGVFGPILIKILLLRRIPVLDRMTD